MNGSVRNAVVLGCLLGAITVAVAGKPAPIVSEPEIQVVVRVYNYAQVPGKVLGRAQSIASQIFAHAGVELVWAPCPVNGEDAEEYAACHRPAGPTDLALRILLEPKARYASQGEVFGFALLPEDGGMGRVANVYFERVEEMAWDKLNSAVQGIFASQMAPQVCVSLAVGIVAAHELGHLMLGSNSHSSRGIMQPAWDRGDFEDAFYGRQGFTPGQVKKLRTNLLGQTGTIQALNRAGRGEG